MSNGEKSKREKCKDLIEKTLKRKMAEKQNLQDVDKEIDSELYTIGEINFRLYCHIVGYGDQVQKLIYDDKVG